MNIYSPIVITEKIKNRYKPTRLAVKELNGIKYFCKSVKKNMESYTGSGVRWLRHVKKHGKENIKTLWISDWFNCPSELQKFALEYSEKNNIVESEDWANLVPENGLDGGSIIGHMAGIPKPKSLKHRESISKTLSGITLEERHGKFKANEIRLRMSNAHSGKKRSPESVEKTRQLHIGRKRTEETRKKMRETKASQIAITCTHCKKNVLPGNFHRWHGDYCLSNPNHLPRKVNTENSCKNASKKIIINGAVYSSLKEAYTTLDLPRNLLGNMIKNNINSNPKWGINYFKIINDDASDQ